MLAETMVRWGRQLVEAYPPDGRSYWAARFWDRTPIESAASVGDDHREDQQHIIRFLRDYGQDAQRVLEFSCGIGDFTNIVTGVSAAEEIEAVDISEHALEIARRTVRDPRVRFVQGDFWNDLDLEKADVVVCLHAIHHMGRVREVVARLKTFVKPGGILVGNIWTLDNYHDWQRSVHGPARHLARSALFLANALVMRATGGRVRWASYRTQILPSAQVRAILASSSAEVLETTTTKFFVNFAVRC